MPREHHFAFAKQVLPSQAFQSPDKVFAELRGPMREPFLFFLWQELGKTVQPPLPHVDVGPRRPGGHPEMVALDVAAADVRQGAEVVVVQLPPAQEANEAWFVALIRRGHEVRVFTWERSVEGDAVLAEIRQNGRANYGFYPNWSLEGFLDALGDVIGVPLHGLPKPTSTPMDAATGRAPGTATMGRTKPAQGLGKNVAALAGIRAAVPVALWMAGFVVPGLLFEMGTLLHIGTTLLSLAVGIMTLVWLHRVFTELKGRTHFSPGMAVGSWFIPVANFLLPAFVLKDAWRTARGNEQGSGLVYGFWAAWMAQTIITVAGSPGFDGAESPLMGFLFELTYDLQMDPQLVFTLYGLLTMTVAVAAYGLLALVVRKISVDA